jgi:hypothetical protein
MKYRIDWVVPGTLPNHVTVPGVGSEEPGIPTWTEENAVLAQQLLEYNLGWQVELTRIYE